MSLTYHHMNNYVSTNARTISAYVDIYDIYLIPQSVEFLKKICISKLLTNTRNINYFKLSPNKLYKK